MFSLRLFRGRSLRPLFLWWRIQIEAFLMKFSGSLNNIKKSFNFGCSSNF
jgi:hypothetical protein